MSAQATNLRTQINNESASLQKNEAELAKNKAALANLATASDDAGESVDKAGEEAEKAGKKAKGSGDDAEEGGKGWQKFGDFAKSAAKVAAAAAAACAGAVVGLVKSSVESYAEYEQLVGGVETLFKDSGDKVMQYANNAYKTAGLSANEYMDTVTSFSASLISSLHGDTAKAAEVADLAITDMSDNANKMGTDMTSIQNAYQGFAKQNYTMLDNLKLGYGGTKEEMQRLLKDAEKISGQKFDLSNYADVVEAIHVVQTEMEITGTTAKEASSTISGSLGMTKAAWQNVLTGMSDDGADFDGLIDNLVSSVEAFIGNIMPRIQTALNGIVKLIAGLAPQIPPLIAQLLPGIVDAVIALTDGIASTLPDILKLLPDLVNQIIQALPGLTYMILDSLLQSLSNILSSLGELMPTILAAVVQLACQICDAIIGNAPLLVTAAIQF